MGLYQGCVFWSGSVSLVDGRIEETHTLQEAQAADYHHTWPVDNATLINAISRSVVQQRGLAEGAKDPLSRQRAEKAADDGEKIIMQIDREGETVGLMSVSVMPIAKDEKTFKKVCRRAESMVSVMKCKMRVIPNLQKESFRHISPSFPTNAKIESILQKNRADLNFCRRLSLCQQRVQ